MLKKMHFILIIITIGLILNSCERTADEHYHKSMEFAMTKDFSSAITELDKAIAINPNYSKAYLDRG